MENNLLLNALIYLAAAVITVPIARRLGLGAVLGYLAAGIAIGPFGFGLIREVEVILHFSEFGVVLLLFLIGLELDPKRLWSMRKPIFGWGSAQVGLVTVALCAVGVLTGIDWKIALIASLGLSLSSTAIVLATLDERNLMATPAGSASFSILLFQDIAAIPMIAIVPMLGVSAAADGVQSWLDALKVIGVVIALIVGGRYLVRPLLRAIAKTGMRELFTAFALLLVIGIGLLMQSVGVSMALGTFLAGVLLADSEYRHALESDLEPFKGLLLGLFFIAVGMSVDFGVLLAHPVLISAAVFAFLAIKIGMLYGMGKRFGIPRSQQLLFALLLSQGGEFAFVVFGAAATARVFTPEVASMLVLVVALSMLMTPLLLLLYDRLIAPRFQAATTRPDDALEEREGHVIIAGFGRFGQIVGRLLNANQVPLTVLDHDPDQIDLLRKFGFEVFYGDATRTDLLHAAGAARARALVVAIDDVEDSLALVDAVKQEFPDLPILARARNVTHYYDLMDRGVTMLERETFEGSLRLGRQVLQTLGYGAYQARQAAMKFRAHNIASVHAVYPYYKDQEQYVSMARQARDELAEMFARDIESMKGGRSGGWD
ncbi:glutathione-regulated potassium-efflux system protein KefC [Noviherbaspirillum sedimenti]|uniref:Glutathione-regulated potassium-efflux system protein KefC n=1 Tax=Noviherbaspirillum sedimenti TaxID=2320865 RepID=A0A3A3GQ50_9BURK|nr:glutathione-regulated potassium-efflux system protein KefC [Noviherbaspirillum sedimenti]RJG04466.1 glutathione-regulated potassium-efflux system protein KefC [Noviherbaspirillum sedimenti]